MTATAEETGVGLSRTAAGDAVPTAVRRARRISLEDPFTGWVAAISVTLLAAFLRLWHLGLPRSFSFDETYYAKESWSLWTNGYVRDSIEDANSLILGGQTSDLWQDKPSLVVHPDVGRIMIGLGEQVFGLDPFGWRIASAIVGSLMVLVICRLVKRLSGSTLIGCLAGLLLALDGLHLVMSRLALLDIFLAFWLLLGVHCLVLDRDRHRRRMADRARLDAGGRVVAAQAWGPVRGLLLRPWMITAGVCFGLAVGTKWSALYPLAAFGLLAWAWSAGARRSFGVRRAWLRSTLVDGVPAFLQLVPVALVVYVATWTPWLLHAAEYEEQLSNTQYTTYAGGTQWPTATEADTQGLGEVTQSLRSLWYYHQDVYTFHTHFLNESTHPYASKPRGWLLISKPVGVDAQLDIQPGDQGCDAVAPETCQRVITALGNPVIWWGACLALVFSVAMWVGARDWRFGVPVVGVASTWLPWLQYDDRPIFYFYAVATVPFLVIAVALTLGRIIGPDLGPSPRRTVGVAVAGTYVVLVILAFAWFWPVWTDALLTRGEWADRMWLRRWI